MNTRERDAYESKLKRIPPHVLDRVANRVRQVVKEAEPEETMWQGKSYPEQ